MESKGFVKGCWLLVVATLLLGCGNSVAMAQSVGGFRPVEIPSVITNIDSRREYLALHYWDNFDFGDVTLMKNDSLMSVVVGGYVGALMMNPPVIAQQSVNRVLNRALKSGYDQFECVTSKLEDWLYNPNSPMRNEELYIYVLRHTVDKAELEDIYKIRSRSQLTMALKNRIGEVATDFRSKDSSGESYTLHQISTPFTILFFNTPDCDDCRRVKEYIDNSSLLSRLEDAEKLTILGVYTEGDEQLWLKTKYPSVVVNTNDNECNIAKNRLYDLKALPTLYLLDRDKKVMGTSKN